MVETYKMYVVFYCKGLVIKRVKWLSCMVKDIAVLLFLTINEMLVIVIYLQDFCNIKCKVVIMYGKGYCSCGY
jgi:hypothetical protein